MLLKAIFQPALIPDQNHRNFPPSGCGDRSLDLDLGSTVAAHSIDSYNDLLVQSDVLWKQILFGFYDVPALIGAATGTDPMRLLGLLALRADGNAGGRQKIVGPAHITF
jgi:hypothetical protein